VIFRDGPDGRRISLYAFACRTVEDVAFALKTAREQVGELNVWEKAG